MFLLGTTASVLSQCLYCYFLLEDQASFSQCRCTYEAFAYLQCVALLNYYFVCLH